MFTSIISGLKSKIGKNLMRNSVRMLTKMRGKGILSPPECVRGMTELDTRVFDKSISVPYIETNASNLESVLKCVKPFLMKMFAIKPVIDSSDESDNKLILLNPELISSLDDLSDAKQTLFECDIKELRFRDLLLTYENFNWSSIFDAVLPEMSETISGYSEIGHILHLNLRDHTLPFKHLIGRVLLDKVRKADMVVNKLANIDNQFRNFEMEVIAKRSDNVNTIVKVKEKFVDFEFDFAKVYWNPRLSTERERVVGKLQRGVDVLYDVFAGVGPFALCAAKMSKCFAVANDLNPECYKWLLNNAKLNKVENKIKIYNMDGRDFIRNIVRNDIIDKIRNPGFNDMNAMEPRFHIVMNLPAIAYEFLSSFQSFFCDYEIETKVLPIVHLYCFVKGEQSESEKHEIVKEMARSSLDCDISTIDEIFFVRTVAPNKDMFRISFTLPEDVLYAKHVSHKRQKIL